MEGGAGWKPEGWSLLTRAELVPVLPGGQPHFCQISHCLACPGNKWFSANQCHGIKSSVKCCLLCGAPLGGQGGRVPHGPRTWDLAQDPPLTAELGLPPSTTSVSSRMIHSWAHSRLMPGPHSG